MFLLEREQFDSKNFKKVIKKNILLTEIKFLDIILKCVKKVQCS